MATRFADRTLTPLTGRERQILALLATGLTRRETARLLSISIETVRSHIAHVSQRLGTKTLVEAFFELGWLTVPDDG